MARQIDVDDIDELIMIRNTLDVIWCALGNESDAPDMTDTLANVLYQSWDRLAGVIRRLEDRQSSAS